MLGFLLVYSIWYWVNRDFYNFIMLNETAGRFPTTWNDFLAVSRFNFINSLWTIEIKLLLILGGFVALAFPFWKIWGKKNIRHELILLFGFAWIILELHKLPMVYIPNRYLLSLYFAVGILVSAGLTMLYDSSRYGKSLAFAFAMTIGLIHMTLNYESFSRRTYDLEAVNHYFEDKKLMGGVILGSWAPSLTWDTKVRTIPVWNNYFNWKDPVKTFHPLCIVSEFNEAESDHAYEQQGINLDSISDSVRLFKIWRYDVKVYWIKPTPALFP
jgi:hypothetical protein